MSVEALKGCIIVYAMYMLHMFSVPVAVGLCACFALALVIDIRIHENKK